MRVEERIISILLAEKIKENPEYAKKIGIKISDQTAPINKNKVKRNTQQ